MWISSALYALASGESLTVRTMKLQRTAQFCRGSGRWDACDGASRPIVALAEPLVHGYL